MEKLERVSAKKLPKPCDLDQTWMKRLGISEKLQRLYWHLSRGELMALEGLRIMADWYKDREMLQPERTPNGLIRRFVKDVDRHWLKTGKGRAVDLKRSLEVLQVYAIYREWAEKYLEDQHVAYEAEIPYSMWRVWESGFDGPGFLSLRIKLLNPSLGILGDIRWRSACIEIVELQVTPVIHAVFEKNPTQCLDKRRWMRTFGACSDRTESDKQGLVGWMIKELQGFSNEVKGGSNITPCQADISWDDPTREQLVKFLDIFSELYYQHRVPRKPAWQFEFQVTEGLEVYVQRKEPDISSFGTFFEKPTERENTGQPSK